MPTNVDGLDNQGLKYIPHTKIVPNPYNPRKLFDRTDLDVLKESIKNVGVLVPLLVYFRKKDEKVVILDGERRWICVGELLKEYPKKKEEWFKIPVNMVPEPDMVSNILYMFNIHNVRQPWELMPTAIKLEVLMIGLKERDNKKIAELTGLSSANVQRCKVLLSFDKKYQQLMMADEPEERIKADFFLELHPLLNLIEKNLHKVSELYREKQLIEIFLQKYLDKQITNVLHLRDLADIIRSMKKDIITHDDCEKIFLDLIESEEEVKEYVTSMYTSTKITEELYRSLESCIQEITTFDPTTARERDRIFKILLELRKAIDDKIKSLDNFGDKE